MPRGTKASEKQRAADGRRIYSLGDVTRLTGVPRPQAQYWLKHRVIVPDYVADGGPGKYHGFTFRNLIEFELCRRLSWFGASIVVFRHALSAIRAIDLDDWYEAMPSMRAALAALPKQKRPTKKEAIAWLDRHLGPPLMHTDPEAVATFNRYAAASGLFDLDTPLSEDEQRDLLRWRQFKDPRTRSADLPALLYSRPNTAWIAFGEVDASHIFRVPIPTTLFDLTSVFEHIESVTGDSWNKVGDEE